MSAATMPGAASSGTARTLRADSFGNAPAPPLPVRTCRRSSILASDSPADMAETAPTSAETPTNTTAEIRMGLINGWQLAGGSWQFSLQPTTDNGRLATLLA